MLRGVRGGATLRGGGAVRRRCGSGSAAGRGVPSGPLTGRCVWCARGLAAYGADSGDRVHKSFFYGSKHIDSYVPKVDPQPRLSHTNAKQAQWQAQMAPAAPTDPSMCAPPSGASDGARPPPRSPPPPCSRDLPSVPSATGT